MAYNNIAWLRATCSERGIRDGKKAIAAAGKACGLTKWNDFNAVDTLAAAYAEGNNFAAVIKSENQAMNLPGIIESDKEGMHNRLLLYERHLPNRQ